MGFIAPLSTRATDLGIGPANAVKLAVNQYNETRSDYEPKVNLFLADDQWDGAKALPAYKKLKADHDIDVLFISNSDGTIAVQEAIKSDNVLAVNPLNNDATLAEGLEGTFLIAKSTKEANAVVGIRIVDLGLKNVLVLSFPNRFMRKATESVIEIFDEAKINYHSIEAEVGQTDFSDLVSIADTGGYEAFVMFGYKEFGFAMKQLREAGHDAPFFGSTVLLDPAYFLNSDGEVVGTECTYFTEVDGNVVLAKKFLTDYESAFNSPPSSVWPPMQAYDATNMLLSKLRHINREEIEKPELKSWLVQEMRDIKFYQGVCGNISIQSDNTSRGIYFALYKYVAKGKLEQVKE